MSNQPAEPKEAPEHRMKPHFIAGPDAYALAGTYHGAPEVSTPDKDAILTDAIAAKHAAVLALYAVELEKRQRIRDGVEKVQASADAEFADRIATATAAVREATAAADQARIAAKADEGPPVGARYAEWRLRRGEWFAPGRVAVVEQHTGTSQFPANRHHGRPYIGDKFFRVLDKAGKPGLRFAKLGDYGWFPEGVDPNKEGK